MRDLFPNEEFPNATSIFEGIKEVISKSGGNLFFSEDGYFNQDVDIVIRPEAIKLNLEKSPILNPFSGVVVDSKFLGNNTIVHMTVIDSDNNKHHIHSKLIGEFLPSPASSVSFSLDLNHVFIFPR